MRLQKKFPSKVTEAIGSLEWSMYVLPKEGTEEKYVLESVLVWKIQVAANTFGHFGTEAAENSPTQRPFFYPLSSPS